MTNAFSSAVHATHTLHMTNHTFNGAVLFCFTFVKWHEGKKLIAYFYVEMRWLLMLLHVRRNSTFIAYTNSYNSTVLFKVLACIRWYDMSCFGFSLVSLTWFSWIRNMTVTWVSWEKEGWMTRSDNHFTALFQQNNNNNQSYQMVWWIIGLKQKGLQMKDHVQSHSRASVRNAKTVWLERGLFDESRKQIPIFEKAEGNLIIVAL